MPAPLCQLYVVTHTHWDREWYHTAERFRQNLLVLVDDLLDTPPAPPLGFLLDGQAIVLEDYLAVRPERAVELAWLLEQGRLEAGPWYVLPDELIPSGEALVRNLLAGRAALRQFRGEPPPVLYCPDSFGHPAILPDLAAGFGCELIVLWRGLGGRRWPAADVMRWAGAGGSDALVYHLPPEGYEFGSSLPTSSAMATERWARMRDVLAPRATTGVAMLLNGADHHARQRDLAEALAALAAASRPVDVRAGSLRVAAEAIIAAAQTVAPARISGELRDSYGYTWTLQGTLGTRARQKRRNARAERRMVRDVEPWIALADQGGAPSARALLRAAWRTLLQAHPHDTLCGTSIDAVARAFDARLDAVDVQSRGLRTDALHALAGHDRERARSEPAAWRPAVLIRNPAARTRSGVIELSLTAPLADIAVGPGSAARQGARRRAPAWRVDGVRLQVLSRAERVDLTESPRAYPDADLVIEARAVGWMPPVRGYSIETRPQRGGSGPSIPNPVVAGDGALDNGRVRIEIGSDGRVSFEDRELARRIPDIVSLERRRDDGDLYTPALREALPAPRAARVRLVHRGPLRGEIRIEYEVAGITSRRAGRCRIAIQLDADSCAMRIVVRGDNREHDHRARLRLATGLTEAVTIADAAFLPVERRKLSIDAGDARMEHVTDTAPLHRWVARFTAQAGVVLVSDGLAEYESDDDGGIAVTLLRAVGELSKSDLPERPGHAAWPAPTPGAQCLGPYDARFALRMTGPDSPSVRDDIEHFAEDMLHPLVGETLRSNLRKPQLAAGLELRGAGLAFSAAAPAQRDGWIVLRCVNLRSDAVRGEWRLARGVGEAFLARLDETVNEPLPLRDGVVSFVAAPHAIVTILAR